MNTKNLLKQTVALIAVVLAGLCAAPSAWAQSNAKKGEGVFIRIFTFAEKVNPVAGPVLVTPANAGSIIDEALKRYDISDKAGTQLYYAVQTGISAIKEDSYDFPDDVTSISLLIFTDGLDMGSTASNLPPIGQDRISFATKTSAESKEILRSQFDILQDGIVLANNKRIPVDVYSIGLKGADVTDEREFQASLQAIASEPSKAIKADDLDMVKEEFNRIATDLSKKTSKTILTIPEPPRGAKVRWTFDIPSVKEGTDDLEGYNKSAAAEGSRYYMEGIFGYLKNSEGPDIPIIDNITYSNVSSLIGGSIRGTQNSSDVDFVFEALETGEHNQVREWVIADPTSSNQWHPNTETDKNIQDTMSYSTAVIYIVLDQSKSMSQRGIQQVREAVKDFIESFVPSTTPPAQPPKTPAYTPQPAYDYTPPYTPPAPAPAPEPKPAPAPSQSYNYNPANYLFVDTAPLLSLGLFAERWGVGLGYERAFGDGFSMAFYLMLAGASTIEEFSYRTITSDYFDFFLFLRPRWYPLQSAVGKWYLGGALGYGMEKVERKETYTKTYGYGDYGDTETYTDNSSYSYSGLFFGLETGYKFIIGNFGIEPWLGFIVGTGGMPVAFPLFGVTLGFAW